MEGWRWELGGGGGADNSNVLFVHSTKNISCSPSS